MTKRSEFELRHAQEFSLLHIVHAEFGARPAPTSMGTGIKRLEISADYSILFSAKDKNKWFYTSTPPYTFMT
jgi:hypothetical protein